jgi:Integrase core domain.
MYLKGVPVAKVAAYHGICRMSVYRWVNRYKGTVESLVEKSHRPRSHPRQHTLQERRKIRKARKKYGNLGLVCFHMKMEDEYGYSRSTGSLYKMMKKMGLLKKKQRKKTYKPKPYETPTIPGEKIQIDVKYVPKECHAQGLEQMYQFTAIDEATRIRHRRIYEDRSSWTAMKFIHEVRKQFPFRIKCVQTDNGTEFTNAMLGTEKKSSFELYLEKRKSSTSGYGWLPPGTTAKLSESIGSIRKDFMMAGYSST